MAGFTMETGLVDSQTVVGAVENASEAGDIVLEPRGRIGNGKVKLWGGPLEIGHDALGAILTKHLSERVTGGQFVKVLSITKAGAKVRLVPVPGDEDVAAEPAEEDSDAEGPE